MLVHYRLMKIRWAHLGAVFLMIGLVETALSKKPLPALAPVAVPPLHFQHTTLANGLQIYAVEDHSSPTVAVQVWYHVGSKDDPNGRSGFAHLFEHMMFKGNEHLTPDSIDELTENVGGANNAYTADDVTVYHEVVPSNYLEPILWAEGGAHVVAGLNGVELRFRTRCGEGGIPAERASRSLRRILPRYGKEIVCRSPL